MGLFSSKKKAQTPLKFWALSGSLHSNQCRYLLAEKHLQAIQLPLDATAPHDPFGKQPILADGDRVVAGVASILPYLDVKGGGRPLIPKKANRLGEQNYWMEIGQHVIQPALSQADAAALEALNTAWRIADQQLNGRQYFATDFSLADICWVSYLHAYTEQHISDGLRAYPQLERWFKRMQSQPAYQQLEPLATAEGV